MQLSFALYSAANRMVRLRTPALRDQVWGVTEQIDAACRLDDEALAALRDTLDGLAHPAPGAGRPSHHPGKDPR
jgi:hypothetical protein